MTELPLRLMQKWWRLTRSHTLGVQGMIIAPENQVLLVRHSYRPGWHFPGGGVERGETVTAALHRELIEETGTRICGEPELHGLFANFQAFPNDHIAFYVIRHWQRDQVPAPNREIVEQGFFPIDALPEQTATGARNRIAEIFHGVPRKEDW